MILSASVCPFFQVLDPWNAPRPLTRAWCLWELYCAIHSETRIDVVLSPGQAAAFHTELVTDFPSIAANLCKVDARAATAFKASDLEMIKGAIHQNLKGGFVELNTVITGLLRKWLADSGRRELASLPADTRALQPLQNQVANLLADLGDAEGARALYEEALAARRERLGERHSDTLLVANNLFGLCLQSGAPSSLLSSHATSTDVSA